VNESSAQFDISSTNSDQSRPVDRNLPQGERGGAYHWHPICWRPFSGYHPFNNNNNNNTWRLTASADQPRTTEMQLKFKKNEIS